MAANPRSQYFRLSPTRAGAELATRRLDKGVARYYRLYELLSSALQDGTIAPGSALPSEPELCVHHGLSRTTVRRALDRLERERRITRKRGSGTYARAPQTVSRICLELDSLPDGLTALEAHTTTKTLRAGPAPVPQALRAMATGIGPTAYLLERLRCRDGEPLSLTSTYLPEPVGRRMRRATPGSAAVMTILDRLGLHTDAVRCSVGVAAADSAAANRLEVPLGSALLRMRSVLTGDTGAPWAVLESLCRSDRVQLKVTESA